MKCQEDKRSRVQWFDSPEKSPKNKLVPIIHPCTTTLRFVIFSLSFVFPSFIPDVFMVLINQPLRVSLPSVQTVSVFPGNRRVQRVNEGRFCTGHMSGSLAMWNRERVVTANYWTTPAPEIKATASHERTGLGLKAVGAWKEMLGELKDGWVEKGTGQIWSYRDRALRRKQVWLLGVSEVWGWLTPEGRTTPVSLEEGMHWCLGWHPAVPLKETQRMPPPDTATIF